MISPYKFSVVYEDSIPLFALFFKLFSPILPKTFQYFGLFGIVCYILQSILGCELIYRFTRKTKESLCGSLFFALSPTMAIRMFGHTALAFHPIILLSILMFFDKQNLRIKGRDVICWSALIALALSIHAYFFPMVFAFIFAYYFGNLISCRWYRAIFKIGICLLVAILTMYVWGYFYGAPVFEEGGVGAYNSNLNVLIDGAGISFLGSLAGITGTLSIGEAYAYLGAGILFLGVVISFDIIQKKKYKEFNKKYIPVVILIIIFLVASIYPAVRIGPFELLSVKGLDLINRLFSVFRANGRFMWPVVYLIMTGVIVYIANNYNIYGKYLLIVCVIIQIVDLYPVYRSKIDNINSRLLVEQKLDGGIWDQLAEKEEIYFMNEPLVFSDGAQDLGSFAADKGMVMNDYLVGRKNATSINYDRSNEQEEIYDDKPDENKIYVFQTIPCEYLCYDFGLHIYEMDNFYIGITDELPDVNEVSIEDGLNLLQYSSTCVESLSGELIDSHVHFDEQGAHLHANEKMSNDIVLGEGVYEIIIKGDNLNNLDSSFLVNGENLSEKLNSNDNEISLRLSIEGNRNIIQYEFDNNGAGEVLFSNVMIQGNKSSGSFNSIDYGKNIYFTSELGYDEERYIMDGMSGAETEFTWTLGKESNFQFMLSEPTDVVKGTINTFGVFNGEQRVDIYVNDILVSQQAIASDEDITFDFDYPTDGVINLRLVFPDAVSPLELGVSDDYRVLALAIRSIRFERVP